MELLEKFNGSKKSLTSFGSVEDMWGFSFSYVRNNKWDFISECWDVIKENRSKEPLTEEDFLPEYCFCVYVSGFKAEIIANKFKALTEAHNIYDFEGNYIPSTKDTLLEDPSIVYSVFKNKRKAKAVQTTRRLISELGWEDFYSKYVKDRNPFQIMELDYMGPALSNHLARNLGNWDIVKSDVHLNRLSLRYGFNTAEDLCGHISNFYYARPLGFIDLILWVASAHNGTK